MLRQRKKRKKIKSYLFLLIFLLLFLISLYIFNLFMTVAFNKPILVSPVPSVEFSKSRQFVLPNNTSTRELEKILTKKNIKFLSIDILVDSSYLVKLEDKKEIIFSPTKSLDLQVSSLQLVLSRLTIEGKRFNRLDFRFDKPVVVFE